MNEKALKKLEYDKIIQKLASFAVSPMAKEKIQNMRPYTAMSDITAAQQETTEAVSMILRKGTLTLGGFKEIRPQLKRAAMGGVLSMGELHSWKIKLICVFYLKMKCQIMQAVLYKKYVVKLKFPMKR